MTERGPITRRQLRAARQAAQQTKAAYEQMIVDAVWQRGHGGQASVAADLDIKRQTIQKILAKVKARETQA